MVVEIQGSIGDSRYTRGERSRGGSSHTERANLERSPKSTRSWTAVSQGTSWSTISSFPILPSRLQAGGRIDSWSKLLREAQPATLEEAARLYDHLFEELRNPGSPDRDERWLARAVVPFPVLDQRPLDLGKPALARVRSLQSLRAEVSKRMPPSIFALMSMDDHAGNIRVHIHGLDEPDTREFGRSCLVARRLVQRGVRFVELLTPAREADRWDQHFRLEEGHRLNSRAVDKPLAALIKDLKGLGMLDETIVIWGGEFGRTPTAQIPDEGIDLAGRDHNPLSASPCGWPAAASRRV